MFVNKNTAAAHLQESIRNAMASRKAAAHVLEFIPQNILAKLILVLVEVYNVYTKVPKRVWSLLYSFLAGDEEELRTMTLAEAKQLIGALKVALLLKIEVTNDPNELEQLRQFLSKVEALERQLETVQDVQLAIDRVLDLLGLLLQQFPTVVRLLYSFFSEDLKTAAFNAFEKKLPAIVIKQALKMAIHPMLIKRYGDLLAKKLMPFVGLAMTLVEFSAIVGLLARIEHLDRTIDALLAELIHLFIEPGELSWPAGTSNVWIADRPDTRNRQVRITPFVHCFEYRDGDLRLEEHPKQIAFTEGRHLSVLLDHTANHFYDPHTKTWEFNFYLDNQSVKEAIAHNPTSLCITYLEIIVSGNGGESETHLLIVGGKREE